MKRWQLGIWKCRHGYHPAVFDSDEPTAPFYCGACKKPMQLIKAGPILQKSLRGTGMVRLVDRLKRQVSTDNAILMTVPAEAVLFFEVGMRL